MNQMADILDDLIELQKDGERSHHYIVRCSERAIDEIKSLRSGFKDIQKAIIEGRISDDTIWLDAITTLYDFCELLSKPNR